MRKQMTIISSHIIGFLILFSSMCIAGSANLTLVHEDPNIKVAKYIIKYSINEADELVGSGTEIQIYPTSRVAVQSTQRIDLGEGKSGNFYFVVKEIYEDGSESGYSDKSLPITIPQKPRNLTIK